MKSKISKTSAKVISDVMLRALKNCKTPTERAVLVDLNNEFIRETEVNRNISHDSCNIIINCFDREKSER